MADDEAPRLAPPPRPTMLQLNIPRPEVPEVSLMFDSDDSLIWNKSNSSSKSAPLLQHQNMKSHQLPDASLKRSPLVRLSSHLHEKENLASQSPLIQNGASHGNLVHKVPVNEAVLRLSHKNLGSHHYEDKSSPVVSGELKNTNPRKTYNPMLYSPSQKITGRVSMDLPSEYFRPRTPLVESNKNTVQTGAPISSAGIVTVDNLGTTSTDVNQPLPSLRKAVHFSQNSPLSYETSVRPKSADTSSRYINVTKNQHNMASDYKSPSAVPDNMHFSNRRNDHRNTGYVNTHLLASANSVNMQTPPVRFEYPVNSYRNTEDANVAWQSNNISAGRQTHQYGRIQETIDPKVYQLIEDQNQHILKLYKTLEGFLEKKQPNEPVDNVKNKDTVRPCFKEISQQTVFTDMDILSHKHTSTQTNFPEHRGTRSVGVNTDISWEELLSLIRSPVSESSEGIEDQEILEVRGNARQNVPHQNLQRHVLQAESRERTQSRQKDFANLEQKFSSGEMREVSLTMREVVMTTIHEDQSSPDPSMHINMEEYREDSIHDPHRDSQSECQRHISCPNAPVIGESASAFKQSSRSVPQREECNSNEASAPSDNPPSGTFYNNVLTNIQQILQSSKTTDDEEAHGAEENNNQEHDVREGGDEILDPQMEAVRKQLLQFGISFIDPISLAPKHRPLLDTMYMPAIHNMLSIYQSTIVAPYNNVFKETDSLAAKYLTDTQLAAIASMSPAMNKRTQNINSNSVRGRDTSVPYGNQFKPRNNSIQARHYPEEDEVSITTKKFLGKYGLTDNM